MIYSAIRWVRVRPEVLFLTLTLFYVGLLSYYLFTRHGIMGGADGVLHLTTIEEQIRVFKEWGGATDFSSLGRYVGDVRPLYTYQGFYWFAGLIGYLFHLKAYSALLVTFCFIPLLAFLICLVSFEFVENRTIRAAAAFVYATSPMIFGFLLYTSSWPMIFSTIFCPLLILGCWRFRTQGTLLPFFLGLSLVVISHPFNALLEGVVLIPVLLYLFLK